MRLLHTSDWHLGLTLEGMPMLDHQRDAIDFIVRAVQEHEIDAVLISGDIYDRSLPPIEAVALFEDGLVALARHCTVVVTSGNHDSAVRLGFGSRLFADRVQLRTSLDRIDVDGIPATPGQTFWVAVGLKGSWSGDAATLRVDR